MADVTTINSVIEIQKDGTGVGSRYALDVARDNKYALGGFDRSYGDIQREWRVSPRTNTFVPRPPRRDRPESPAPELSCLMQAANYIERLDPERYFALYVREVARHPLNPLDYSRVDILVHTGINRISYGDRVSYSEETDVEVTIPLNAATHVRIDPVAGKKLATAFTNANDVDIKAMAVDEDGVIYAVTGLEATPVSPYLVYSADDGATWTEVSLTDLDKACTGIAVAGDYLIISAGTSIAVYTKAGVLVSEYTAAQTVNALFAIDAVNIVAAGAAGLLLFSEDGGASWDTVSTGISTALNALACRNINEWWIGGASGKLLKYDDGTVSTVTLPVALSSATINAIALPDVPAGYPRDETVYIGASTGDVYKSEDGGDTWEQVAFPGDGAGSVTALAFVEFMGQVLYVLHTLAGGASVLYRDWSGGAGGNANMESVTIPTNSGVNALLAVDANNAWLGGKVHSTAEMVIKVEA